MKKQRHLSADALLAVKKAQTQALEAAGKSMQLITLIILHEKYQFGPKRLNEFMEHFEDVLDYYNNSNDYQALLREWADYFKEYAGIQILPGKKEEK